MADLKPIDPSDRNLANIHSADFKPFLTEDGGTDGEVLQVNGGRTGYGFHIYRMQPGQTTVPHEHIGDEEFFLIEGDLVDHDGHEYLPGDIVWLRSGTKHCSYSKNGCLLVVYLRNAEGF
ncbi:MAG: cupin domain-containing protein [Pseudomonadota bacterium]